MSILCCYYFLLLLIWANGWVLNVCEESGREVGLDEFDWISVRLTCGQGRRRRGFGNWQVD